MARLALSPSGRGCDIKLIKKRCRLVSPRAGVRSGPGSVSWGVGRAGVGGARWEPAWPSAPQWRLPPYPGRERMAAAAGSESEVSEARRLREL